MCFSAVITILYLLPLKQRYKYIFSFLLLPQIIFPLTKLCCGQMVPSRPPQNISLSECILLSVFSILINLYLDKSCEGQDASFFCSSAGISGVSHHLQTTCWIEVWGQVVCKHQQLCLVQPATQTHVISALPSRYVIYFWWDKYQKKLMGEVLYDTIGNIILFVHCSSAIL